MFAGTKSLIKDVCTIKNGQDFCIAGVVGFTGLVIGVLVMIGAVALAFNITDGQKLVTELGNLLMKFGAYLGTLVSTVCAGKAVKTNAEPG